jgi:hypothetical protein
MLRVVAIIGSIGLRGQTAANVICTAGKVPHDREMKISKSQPARTKVFRETGIVTSTLMQCGRDSHTCSRCVRFGDLLVLSRTAFSSSRRSISATTLVWGSQTKFQLILCKVSGAVILGASVQLCSVPLVALHQ